MSTLARCLVLVSWCFFVGAAVPVPARPGRSPARCGSPWSRTARPAARSSRPRSSSAKRATCSARTSRSCCRRTSASPATGRSPARTPRSTARSPTARSTSSSRSASSLRTRPRTAPRCRSPAIAAARHRSACCRAFRSTQGTSGRQNFTYVADFQSVGNEVAHVPRDRRLQAPRGARRRRAAERACRSSPPRPTSCRKALNVRITIVRTRTRRRRGARRHSRRTPTPCT